MRKRNLIAIKFALLALLITASCGPDSSSEETKDTFNREALLINWADNIIVPGYSNLTNKLSDLKSTTTTFTANPSVEHLTTLRGSWLEAYVAWQAVGMFEIGPAEEITLLNYMNVYPLNVSDLETSLMSGDYDLTSVNRQDEQGFSAVDYLLHGVADTDADIVAIFTDETNGQKYRTYLMDVVTRMESLVSDVLSDWQTGYRDTFVNRSGSSATESVNKIVNDYIFYYEKHLRAGKIGIPAGVFSSTPLSDRVEARFRGDASKELFMTGLDACQDFFNGLHGTTNGIGLDDYLDELQSLTDGEELSLLINDQFDAARSMAENLNSDFGEQVRTDNSAMTMTYDELQKNVVYLKVDMLQALNIKVDYVDADGD